MPVHTKAKRAARNKSLSATKAKKILKDGKVRGKKLSPKQRRFMGARAGGK